MPPSMIPFVGSGITYSMGARNGDRERSPSSIDHADGGTFGVRTHRQTGAGSRLALEELSLGYGWSAAHGGVVSLKTNERQPLPSGRTDLGCRMVARGRFGGLAEGLNSTSSLQVIGGP